MAWFCAMACGPGRDSCARATSMITTAGKSLTRYRYTASGPSSGKVTTSAATTCSPSNAPRPPIEAKSTAWCSRNADSIGPWSSPFPTMPRAPAANNGGRNGDSRSVVVGPAEPTTWPGFAGDGPTAYSNCPRRSIGSGSPASSRRMSFCAVRPGPSPDHR